MSFDTIAAASPEAVWGALAAHVRPARTREIPFEQACGAVLAQDARSTLDYPPFDRAVVDGYAVRCSDFNDRPTRLRCTGLIRAGIATGAQLAPGTCLQINTGAPIPAGADAVVMVERSRPIAPDQVELDDAPTPGQHVERQAAHRRPGDLLVRAGARIGPGAIAALAAGGASTVTIFARPQVALLSTGDELVASGASLGPAQIHDSNAVALERLVREHGGDPVVFGRCSDDEPALRASLELGLADDLLCVVGGMSKGTHDLVPGILTQLGVRWLISGLNLKPGKPTCIGRAPGGCWVLGLPGNPVSCAVSFYLFGRCLLDGLGGLGVHEPPHLAGTLTGEMPKTGERPMYHPAEWSVGARGEILVTPGAWRGSGDPFGLVHANALVQRPAHCPAAGRGETVRFVPLDRPQ